MKYRDLNANALVNAQVDVNRAVFVMNARNNRHHHPYTLLDDKSLRDEALAKHVEHAIDSLKKVQESLAIQKEMFA